MERHQLHGVAAACLDAVHRHQGAAEVHCVAYQDTHRGRLAGMAQYPKNYHMNCPNCNHFPVTVIQVNNTKTEHTTRRKSCPSCNHKWFTVELQIMSWAVKWEKVNPDYRFGGKPTPCVPVSILYGDSND